MQCQAVALFALTRVVRIFASVITADRLVPPRALGDRRLQRRGRRCLLRRREGGCTRAEESRPFFWVRWRRQHSEQRQHPARGLQRRWLSAGGATQ